MSGTRTFPIRIAPLPGEALDSWFETLAYRMHLPAGDLLPSLGLKHFAHPANDPEPQTNWMVLLRPHEVESISAATGVDPSRIQSMTLAAYDGTALLIDRRTHQVNRRRLWGRNAGSRYCPRCLTETEGRWSLSWRLGWSFLCLRHACLLADTCPRCVRMQRIYRFRSSRVLHPAHCAYPALHHTRRTGCDTDLRHAIPDAFTGDHRLVHAQRLILETIETGYARFGIYRDHPVPAAQALADLRAIAGRALSPASAYALAEHLPTDLITLYQRELEHAPIWQGPRHTAVPGFMAPSHAAITAAGLITAIGIMDNPNIHQAGDAMRWLTAEARLYGRTVSPTARWGRGTSPVLDAVLISSLRPVLRTADQLRYRTAGDRPSFPDSTAGRADVLARSTPTLLWPFWSLRLTPADVPITSRVFRAALSASVLLIGTPST